MVFSYCPLNDEFGLGQDPAIPGAVFAPSLLKFEPAVFFLHSTTDNVPDVLDPVLIRTPGRPWKCGYRLTTQVICHNTSSVGFAVVINKDRPVNMTLF
jgi:hypothetical protein